MLTKRKKDSNSFDLHTVRPSEIKAFVIFWSCWIFIYMCVMFCFYVIINGWFWVFLLSRKFLDCGFSLLMTIRWLAYITPHTRRLMPIIGQFQISDIARVSYILHERWGRIVRLGGLLGRPDLLFVYDADEIEKVCTLF